MADEYYYVEVEDGQVKTAPRRWYPTWVGGKGFPEENEYAVDVTGMDPMPTVYNVPNSTESATLVDGADANPSTVTPWTYDSETGEFTAPASYTDVIGEKVLREKRDALLKDSDWTDSAPHLTDEQRTEWQTYRQALRDLPSTATVYLNADGGEEDSYVLYNQPTWPTAPSS